MKVLLRFLFLPALFFLLAGCGTTSTETAVSAEPTIAPQPTAEPTVAAEPTAASRNAYNPDPTLVASTGRPQFVTAYADW